jgi:hypothetical protein
MFSAFASMGWVWLKEGPPAYAATAVSMLFTLWSIWKSEREGFVRSRQMRRAHEPPRNYNGLQVLLLLALTMMQVGLASYFLIT